MKDCSAMAYIKEINLPCTGKGITGFTAMGESGKAIYVTVTVLLQYNFFYFLLK